MSELLVPYLVVHSSVSPADNFKMHVHFCIMLFRGPHGGTITKQGHQTHTCGVEFDSTPPWTPCAA